MDKTTFNSCDCVCNTDSPSSLFDASKLGSHKVLAFETSGQYATTGVSSQAKLFSHRKALAESNKTKPLELMMVDQNNGKKLGRFRVFWSRGWFGI
jgi:hypothetical protein